MQPFSKNLISILLLIIFSHVLLGQEVKETFKHQIKTDAKPWSTKPFYNDPNHFQFLIVSDRTGGHREGVFGKAIDKINQMYPEFVISVGDLIEGYTKDSKLLNQQWDEFHGILDDLQFRFFYTPGNHDYSNAVMAKQWKERYGRDYYSFLYKEVLFIVLNTNDGDGVVIGNEQIEYVKKTLEAHKDVRWTMLFMHHPIWAYRELSGFDQIEEALINRKYSVYAGHTHRYFHEIRNEQNYYVLATTGGGSSLRGPKFGEYDHISWVTMTTNGPQMVNLSLSGMIEHDIVSMKDRRMGRALIAASDFSTLVMEKEDSPVKKIHLLFSNTSDSLMYFKGRFYHHHQVSPDSSKFNLKILPQSTQQLTFKLESNTLLPDSLIDPLEMEWELSYDTPFLKPEFKLSGTKQIEIKPSNEGLSLTDIPIFLDSHTIEGQHPFKGLEMRFSLDEHSINKASELMDEPIEINKTSTITLGLFDQEGFRTKLLKKTYKKVSPLKAVKARKLKPGLKYKYYEGNFLSIPDFSNLEAKKSGVAMEFNPEAIAERLDHYAIQYEGYIEIPSTGIYTFYSYSDDGSKVYVGNKLVVDNDGSHSARMRKGMISLEKGIHPIRVDYFEDFLGETLRLSMEGPEFKRSEIDFSHFSHKP